jgi:DNA invertase Pin-like site-specific DNA recombinase
MRVAIYARYSDDELQNENSIEDQIRILKALAQSENWNVVDVYTDYGVSGASMLLRPGIQKLMEHAQMSMFDIVLTEGLDRLSRDQEDVAGIYKRIKFSGAEIYSYSDGGIVSEIHIGLKGTMNALFLKDLAIKTHRGLSGRVEKGKSGGGICFGYKVEKKLDTHGELIKGDREIIDNEAEVIRRIFKDYAAGISPKKIAFALNEEGVACPSGKTWGQSTINGNRRRGNGILNNELYIGKLVWNRQKYIKNPDTGKRISRLNPREEWKVADVPHLRIIEQDLWDKVKARQKALDEKPNLRAKQRPPKLLSYLLKCGCCDGGMSIVSTGRYGCSTARNKGTCSNRLTIKQDTLEQTVLEALQSNLMRPELIDAFCEEYTKHINSLRKTRFSKIDTCKRELAKLAKDKENIIEAIKSGIPASEVKDNLDLIIRRREKLEAFLNEKDEPQVLLHPNMAKIYKKKIKELRKSLNDVNVQRETAELLRSLVQKIVLTPKTCGDEYSIDLHGDLAGILAIASGRTKPLTKIDPLVKQVSGNDMDIYDDLEVFAEGFQNDESLCKDKLVAGAGFEPTTFGL